jgi:putative hemolysin
MGTPCAALTPLPCARTGSGAAQATLPGTAGLVVGWAQHADEVRQAQRLRYQVFAGELGAKLHSPLPGHDIDRFDDFCEHLLVREAGTGEVIGTYRLLTPAQARRAGGTYTDNEFDLAPLEALRGRMVELGRSCVHPGHRRGGVILALWSALGQFMRHNALDTMIGCASIGRGVAAAGIWSQVRRVHLAPPALGVVPRQPLCLDRLTAAVEVEPPALVQGYLRLGAKVLGPPAWDADFQTADLPLLMRMADLHPRFRQGASGG